MIDINICSKNYEDKTILKDINISIQNEEFISIIGPSGCGKSTLLNIISKLDVEYEGNISIESDDISFVFQDDRLLPWLSIKDNLLLVSKTKNLQEIIELLKLVGLEDLIDDYPKVLSGGMKRRIAFVRAFINQPKVILLDEPFTSLDFPTSQELKEEFLKLCKKFNPIVILVTHDISEAILFSNRIFFLSKNPAKVILEFKNPHDQTFDLKRIDEIKNELFDLYPNILKGEI